MLRVDQKGMSCIREDIVEPGTEKLKHYLGQVCKTRDEFPPFPDDCGVIWIWPKGQAVGGGRVTIDPEDFEHHNDLDLEAQGASIGGELVAKIGDLVTSVGSTGRIGEFGDGLEDYQSRWAAKWSAAKSGEVGERWKFTLRGGIFDEEINAKEWLISDNNPVLKSSRLSWLHTLSGYLIKLFGVWVIWRSFKTTSFFTPQESGSG
jgi:hypothetical protein